ncbi:MAG: cytochrome c biogenesis protein CcdA [Anaerolineales bacterium]
MPLAAPSFGLAFLAGLASFLSPCVFALVPAYVSYLGGRSVADVGGRGGSQGALRHGLAFVLGFSLVFILLGLISSALGALLRDIQGTVAAIGGVVTIALGLHMAGVIRIPFLNFDLRRQTAIQRERGYLASALMGVFFSAGWSPCIGPALGIILTLAANGGSPIQGGLLLSVYSAGLAIPFLLAATQIGWVTYLLKNHPKLGLTIQRIMGILLALVGVLLLTGRLATLSSFGAFFGIYNEAAVGALLLAGLIVSALLGLLGIAWARGHGKGLLEYWALSAGLSFFILVILFLAGAFSFLGIR